ncbi:hypothetical protein AAF712_006617 [Marasmius tenuissimus]|uniref:Uncharacterized protein n=1 Tax=Marasmius tenuissimus TaxID=585030 RepID=A0ABR2ZYC5_9AGAR
MPTIIRFPSVGYQVLSALIYFFGLTILTACASRRLPGSFRSIAAIRDISWGRLLVFLIMADSWLFLFCSKPALDNRDQKYSLPSSIAIGGLLIFGIGMASFPGACTAGPILCVISYGSSKVLIYCFLVEKVHLVWSPTAEVGSRRKSKIWVICMSLNAGYIIVVVLMCLGLIHYYRGDGACVIGLQPFSSIPLIAFDLFITIVLNILFLYPLFSSKISSPKVRAVALRTIAASIAALVTSTVNIAILTALHGHQLGWVCLGSCGSDVILNALIIFWVTGKGEGNSTGNDTYEHEITRGNNTAHDPNPNKGVSFKLGNSKKNTKVFGCPGQQVGEAHALQVGFSNPILAGIVC